MSSHNKLKISEPLAFNDNTPNELLKKQAILDWPVVYIINNQNEVYVGETINVFNRMKQHLGNPDRRRLDTLRVVSNKDFNKSATLDIEASLIELMTLENKETHKYTLQNGNGGVSRHKYAQMAEFNQNSVLFEDLWDKLKQLELVSKDIQELKNSDLFKYSPYKFLNADQCNVRDGIFEDLANFCEGNSKGKTFVINGSAGTGKSILGAYIFKLLNTSDKDLEKYNEYSEDDIEKYEVPKYISNLLKIRNAYGRPLKVAYVISMVSFRESMRDVFKGYGLNKKDVISPFDVKNEHYDILIVDEAHRLKQNVNLGKEKKAYENVNNILFNGENKTQLDWLIKQSDYQIMFYDRKQSIKPTDVNVEDFNKIFNDRNRTRQYFLKTQMRVMAEGNYIDYINSIFMNDPNLVKETFNDYEFKLFNNIDDFVKKIEEKEQAEGLTRMVAGYAWPWKNTKYIDKEKEFNKKKVIKDVKVGNREFYWNIDRAHFIKTSTGKEATEQVGCIHTIQGYDLNYCGVIIGKDLYYNELTKTIEINKDSIFDSNCKSNTTDEQLREYIINIYKVLLTRGIKGTYVYVCDDKLREYLRKYISIGG